MEADLWKIGFIRVWTSRECPFLFCLAVNFHVPSNCVSFSNWQIQCNADRSPGYLSVCISPLPICNCQVQWKCDKSRQWDGVWQRLDADHSFSWKLDQPTPQLSGRKFGLGRDITWVSVTVFFFFFILRTAPAWFCFFVSFAGDSFSWHVIYFCRLYPPAVHDSVFFQCAWGCCPGWALHASDKLDWVMNSPAGDSRLIPVSCDGLFLLTFDQ